MPAWSIKQRLTRSLIALVAAFWLAGVIAGGLVVRHEIDEVFDAALRETAGQIVPVALYEYRLKTAGRPDGSVAEAERNALAMGRGHVHFILRDADGKVLSASEGAPRDLLPAPRGNGFRNHGGFRYFARFLPHEKLWIEVAQEQHERWESVRGIWIGLASPLLALLPIAAFAAWRTVNSATAPLLRVSRDLEARGGNYLEPIEGKDLPAELAPVIDAVNTLMSRLKAALDSERAFAANAAHELRNPIASARAQVQLLASNLVGTADNVRAENIASGLGQLGRRIEKLLQLSRTEAGLGQAREQSDLATIAALVIDDYARRPDVGPRLKLETADDAPSWVSMDPDAVAIVLRNVIENAVHHGDRNGRIEVCLKRDQAVIVTNACALLPAEALKELKGRFRRGRDRRQAGSGLGLAIVETLMNQAGGTVTLSSPVEGRPDGFQVALEFPGATPRAVRLLSG